MRSSKFEYRVVTTPFDFSKYEVQRSPLTLWAKIKYGSGWNCVALEEKIENAKARIERCILEEDFKPEVVEI